MNRFTVNDFNNLINLCQQEKITSLIGKYDREFPSKLLLGMFMKEPRFAQFAKALLQKKRI